MNKDFINSLAKKPQGLFIFIDDDEDEHFLLKTALADLGLNNETRSFKNGLEAYKYLKDTEEDIFLILSDLNMPVMDGLELKRLIDVTPELKIKAIPFIFHSNSGSTAEIKAAYASNIQAFIRKAGDMEGTVRSLKHLIALWTDVVHPKDLEKNTKF